MEEEIIKLETKLILLNQFLGKHKGRGQHGNVTKRVNIVNLPKLEISIFNRDPTKWQSFFDSFQAVGKSTNLTEVEKLTYLRRFLEGDRLNAIARFSLTRDNYKESRK